MSPGAPGHGGRSGREGPAAGAGVWGACGCEETGAQAPTAQHPAYLVRCHGEIKQRFPRKIHRKWEPLSYHVKTVASLGFLKFKKIFE